MNLLVVDESPDYCLNIEEMVKQTDLANSISCSYDVGTALSNINITHYDVILISDGVEQLNGTLLLSEIKKRLSSSQTTLVILSESNDKAHVLDCIHAGAHGVLAKDELDPQLLNHTIIQAQAHCVLERKLRDSYEKVKHMAEHDSLTNVGNRYMFDTALYTQVEKSKMNHRCLGLVMVNIERFKWINDAYGHETGDRVLQHLARIISGLLQENEQVFRLGGDEFAILLSDLMYAHIDDIGQRILDALKRPIEVDAQSIKLNVNMGAAFYPQNARNARELLRSADIAEHCSKKIGSNTICFVDDDIKEQFMRRYQIENDIPLALERNEFVLHYQPVISAKTGRLTSCEALIRWQHPVNGLVFPDHFIHIAEESGLIVNLGRWIIDQALRQLYQWQDVLDDNLIMSINISPQQLYDKDLVEYLDKRRQYYSLLPSQIEIEITETVLLTNTSEVMRTLNAFSHHGYKIALDDFGTGFSSIQHLHSFPISTVKIDRSLMPTLNSPPKTVSLLKGLVAMLNSMDLSIVAEGIETAENMTFCKEIGVDRLQGYYFSKPVSSGEFSALELGDAVA